jgi:hypothetical protein
VSAAHQKLPEHLISLLGDTLLRIPISRLVSGRHKPQVCSHTAALCKARRIFEGQHERERCKRSNSFDLPQEICFFWVVLLADHFQLTVIFADAFCERANRLQDGLYGWPECLRNVLENLVVEAPRWALGQSSAKGLHSSPNVVDQLSTATDQRLTRADDGQMSLGVLTDRGV